MRHPAGTAGRFGPALATTPETLHDLHGCRHNEGPDGGILVRVTTTTAPAPIRLGVLGRGRLGSLVADAAERAADLELVWVAGSEGVDEHPQPVDVAVDVSHPGAVPAHLTWATATRTDLVIGTTGWDHALLARAGQGSAVLVAPNFSVTVALVRRLALALGRYAATRPEPVDLAVSETHHSGKRDAPSGTALSLASALAEGSGLTRGDVPTTSLRLGADPGRHTVHLATAGESVTVTHATHRREVLADGALTAVRWVRGRQGVFTFDDLAEEVLAPLFEPPGHASQPPTSGPDDRRTGPTPEPGTRRPTTEGGDHER